MQIFLNDNLKGWMERTILVEAKRASAAAGLPDAFADHLYIEQNGDKFELVNDWSKDDKPLALWFNYGTVDHYVAPKNAKALAFKGEGTHASAIYYQSGGDVNEIKYSKGHYVSGIPKTEAMEQGLELGVPRLNRLIQREIKRKTKEFAAGGVKGVVKHG